MLIIDAQVYLGHDVVFDEDSTEEQLLAAHVKYQALLEECPDHLRVMSGTAIDVFGLEKRLAV